MLVISNQQGVGKGVMTREDLAGVEERMRSELDRRAGARVDRYYYCTDLKDARSPRRKPEPGMLLEAAEDFGLDLASTIFIGDSPTDIAAGHAAKVGATVLVLSGGVRFYQDGQMQPAPDYVFPRFIPRLSIGYWSNAHDYRDRAWALRNCRESDGYVRRKRRFLLDLGARDLHGDRRKGQHSHFGRRTIAGNFEFGGSGAPGRRVSQCRPRRAAALEVQPGVTPPFHLEASTDIPMQAGLAGSTAILATIVGAVLTYLDLRLNRYETAELVRKIEYDILRCVCGFQDHYMTTFGGLNFMDFREKNSAMPQDYANSLRHDRAAGAVSHVASFYSGAYRVKHHSGTVHKVDPGPVAGG